jgi:hypothetical protein
MEVGEIWKIFKDFLSLFQKRFITKILTIQGNCFEKDAICLDAIKRVEFNPRTSRT